MQPGKKNLLRNYSEMKFMRTLYLYVTILLLINCAFTSCSKELKKKVYSAVPGENFWQTPEQVAAGLAPAYQALTQIPDDAVYHLNEISGGEIIAPTRGNDWDDNGEWSEIFDGIGRCNFILSVVNSLDEQPANIDNINAELKVLRAYYYYLAMDMF